MTADPITLEGLLAAASDASLRRLRVALPAEVVSYDSRARTCVAQPLVQDEDFDEEGRRVAVTLPPIPDVPVLWLGGGGARIRFPVARGDQVLLVFCSSAIGRFKVRGGMTDPQDPRHHDLADAVAIPCVLDQDHADDDAPAIVFTGSTIQAGGNQALVTKAEFDAHVHGGVQTGLSPTSTPTVPITGTLVLKGG